HDMAMTEHYSILMDLPLVNDPEAAKAGRHKLFFDNSMPARYGVIPRHGQGSEIKWFETEPCYVYHSVNAWEEGDEVVLDLCRVTKPEPRHDAPARWPSCCRTCGSTPTSTATASTSRPVPYTRASSTTTTP